MKDLPYLLALGGETAPIRLYACVARCGIRSHCKNGKCVPLVYLDKKAVDNDNLI
jgi:hypothetical protein